MQGIKGKIATTAVMQQAVFDFYDSVITDKLYETIKSHTHWRLSDTREVTIVRIPAGQHNAARFTLTFAVASGARYLDLYL